MTFQVDQDEIVERFRISAMQRASEELQAVIREWLSKEQSHSGALGVPEVDWSRMRQLDLQDALRGRDMWSSRLKNLVCSSCLDFEDHVSTVFV